ncbi:MAG: DUF2585 family protein, partial [Candidatus Pacebacteria bacterium]|nr:DUF2585 family protein [Candidatus Paceibacterota bacterium]
IECKVVTHPPQTAEFEGKYEQYGNPYAYRVWVTVLLIFTFELGCLWWVRDNLTLNIIMLVYPQESIKTWQSEGQGIVE